MSMLPTPPFLFPTLSFKSGFSRSLASSIAAILYSSATAESFTTTTRVVSSSSPTFCFIF